MTYYIHTTEDITLFIETELKRKKAIKLGYEDFLEIEEINILDIDHIPTEKLTKFLKLEFFPSITTLSFGPDIIFNEKQLKKISSNDSFRNLKEIIIADISNDITIESFRCLINSSYVGCERSLMQYFITRPRTSILYFNKNSSFPVSYVDIFLKDDNTKFNQLLEDFKLEKKLWNTHFQIQFRMPIGGPSNGIKILRLNNSLPKELEKS